MTGPFISRNLKELLRDPLTLVFGMGLPVVLICMMSLIQRGAQQAQFEISNFAPGMAVFSFSFITLFSGLLIARDRSGAFLTRLMASPLTAGGFILGYAAPLLPLAILQSVICFAASLAFGLEPSLRILAAIAALIPAAVLFIGFGMLFGSALSEKQVGGFSSLYINLATWLSGTWFPPALVGGAFRTICNLLPFVHAVELVKAALSGDWAAVPAHLFWVLGYAVAVCVCAVWVFRHKMSGDSR